ncbi:MAG: nucleotidyltransferase family protein [Bacteroides sp.]
MKTTTEYLAILKSYFDNRARGLGVTRMALFGSVARKEQTADSDVDVAYEGAPNLLLRIRMKLELEELFGCRVDLIRLRSQLKDTLLDNNMQKDMLYV